MKRQLAISSLLIWILCFTSNGQETSTNAIKLKDLQVPSSPAFILLDVAPTSIEKPSTAKAFTASILNSISENNGLPQNYGVEFTPFWFVKHPTFTAYKYYGINSDGRKRRVFAGLRMIAVSFAFINNNASKDSLLSKTSNLSFGIRSTILKVISKNDLKAIVQSNLLLIDKLNEPNTLITNNAVKITLIKDSLKNIITKIQSDSNMLHQVLFQFEKQRFESALDRLEEQNQELLNKTSQDPDIIKIENQLSDILARKPIFSMDGALALNWAFDNNNFNTNYFDRLGAWLTMDLSLPLNKSENTSPKKNYLNFYALGRYLSGRSLQEISPSVREDVIDYGGKIEIEIERFSLSGEYLYRLNLSKSVNDGFRASGMIKFKIMESLYISGAFGKNFGDSNNLIAQFGINWGFGSGLESVSPIK